jgi:hypothetical protein
MNSFFSAGYKKTGKISYMKSIFTPANSFPLLSWSCKIKGRFFIYWKTLKPLKLQTVTARGFDGRCSPEITPSEPYHCLFSALRAMTLFSFRCLYAAFSFFNCIFLSSNLKACLILDNAEGKF